MSISDDLPVRKRYFVSNRIASKLRRFFLWIILKRTSTEAHVYMRRRQNAKVKHFDVSNVIYHKFSHGAVSYKLNGKNVNAMLELDLMKQTYYVMQLVGFFYTVFILSFIPQHICFLLFYVLM